MTPAQIADILDVSEDAVKAALASVETNQNKSFEDLLDEFRPRCLRILMEITESLEEKTGDRIKAAAVILSGSDQILPDTGDTKLTRMLEKMKKAVASLDIDMKNSLPTSSKGVVVSFPELGNGSGEATDGAVKISKNERIELDRVLIVD